MSNFSLLKKFAKGRKETEGFAGNNAVIYTRVSSKEQADTNKSLDWQKKYCEDYAVKNSLSVLGYFGGTYESAQTDERKEFNRMIKFVRNQKEKISCILVYSLDRFSRSGENAIYISSELKKIGIAIISVTQPIDTNTHTGALQQNIQFIFSKYDNDLRRQKSVDGMREKLLRGEWLGPAPKGYSYDRSNGNKEQKIVINETGELIKKAFYWKLEGVSHPQIMERLNALGYRIAIQSLSGVLENPFYCGLISHNLLQGEIVQGNHPALIPVEVFMKVNKLKKTSGFHQKKDNENLPLKPTLRCAICGCAYTGYLVTRKRLYYYRCNKRNCKCNKSANQLHEMFSRLLQNYRVDSTYKGLLKEQLEFTYNNLTEKNTDFKKELTSKLGELETKIKSVKERFAVGEIDRNLYAEVSAKLDKQKSGIEFEIEKSGKRVSNLQKLIDYTMDLSSKLHTTWELSEYTDKQNLQKIVFPEGLQYHKKTDEYLTPR
ncbi:MAG TPA: recombinase family protein, partial [Bacteroidia bacterium]|nr:recombinase family protein [Bacteroidia bacterium]